MEVVFFTVGAMLSAGGWTLALLIVGPIAWRRFSSWRFEKANAHREGSKHPFLSVPHPLLLPSNLLLSIALLALVYFHMSVLFNPGKVLERSDIFLITNTRVHTPLAHVRSKVASMSFPELGWRQDWGEEGIEKLLRRLGSFEGRKLHLMIGTRPFISCTFCSSSTDYLLFSLIDYITQYAIDLFLFGLLTLRFHSLDIFDEIVFSTVQMISGMDFRPVGGHKGSSTPAAPPPSASTITLRPDGHRYRLLLMYMIGIFVLAQASVYLGLLTVSFGQERWDHWYANFQLAYHSLSLLLALGTYFGQRRAKAMHLTNQTLWSDHGLRERVTKWYDEEGKPAQSVLSDEAMRELETRAAQAGIDVSTVRQEAQTIARELWESTQPSAEFWQQSSPRTPHSPTKNPGSAPSS